MLEDNLFAVSDCRRSEVYVKCKRKYYCFRGLVIERKKCSIKCVGQGCLGISWSDFIVRTCAWPYTNCFGIIITLLKNFNSFDLGKE
jgi:hypothetical protein